MSEGIYAGCKSPHCDSGVLHEPGTCEYCDHFPHLQAQRLSDGVNFTGQTDSRLAPCPATQRRALAVINRWGGNRPARRGDR